ncbi:MAG: hypothetical protein M3Q39_13785, partial [Actinomycetota bacterium]|nr:hypothetical protein [Actinomycetota bacterium]
AQYRGRYQDRSAEADSLLKGFKGSQGSKRPSGTQRIPGIPGTPTTSTSRQVPDELARRQAVAQYLLNRGKPGALLQALQAREAAVKTETTVTPGTPGVPGRTVRTGSQRPARGPARTPQRQGGKLKIEELFYDKGINLDNGGKRVGAIGGHGTHNHVSFGSEASRASAVRLAKKLGLTVTSEGGGKHAAGSFHYRKFSNGRSQAVDFGGPPAALAKFNKQIAARARRA